MMFGGVCVCVVVGGESHQHERVAEEKKRRSHNGDGKKIKEFYLWG